jgi:hypothetical protein
MMQTMNVFLVTRRCDLAWTLRQAKDRMLKYAEGVFEDGEAFFMERTSALAYREAMNKKPELLKYKVYRMYVSLEEEIEWTNEEKERQAKCKEE